MDAQTCYLGTFSDTNRSRPVLFIHLTSSSPILIHPPTSMKAEKVVTQDRVDTKVA